MKKKNTVYSVWSACILLALALSVFAVLFASAVGEKKAPVSAEPSEPPAAAPPSPAEPDVPDFSVTALSVLPETPDAGSEYVNRLCFLGGSPLKHLASELTGENAEKQLWIPSSGKLPLAALATTKYKSPLTGSDVSVSEVMEICKPEYVVILPDAAASNLQTEEQIRDAYAKLITAIREAKPDVRIICASLLPIAENYAYEDVTNEIIRKVNTVIAAAAEASGGKYLDAAAGLIGSDGFLPAAYQDGDGATPTAACMKAWLQYLRTHAYP